jgi:hypothetical protein
MTGELMTVSKVERSRRNDGWNRDIEVVDRCTGKGRIIPAVTAISISQG